MLHQQLIVLRGLILKLLFGLRMAEIDVFLRLGEVFYALFIHV